MGYQIAFGDPVALRHVGVVNVNVPVGLTASPDPEQSNADGGDGPGARCEERRASRHSHIDPAVEMLRWAIGRERLDGQVGASIRLRDAPVADPDVGDHALQTTWL